MKLKNKTIAWGVTAFVFSMGWPVSMENHEALGWWSPWMFVMSLLLTVVCIAFAIASQEQP